MSMTEKGKLEVCKKKLQGICDEHNLVYKFRTDKYPIYLLVKTTGEMSGQMSLLEQNEDDGYISKDAELIFSYKNGDLSTAVRGSTFRIKDTLFNNLKNLFKNMHFLWLQYSNREILERELISAERLPVISDDANDNDIVAEVFDEVRKEMEGLEDYEEEDPDEKLPDDD